MNNNNQVYRRGGLLGLLMDRVQFDWFSSIALSVLMTLLVVFSFVAGTAIWPVVFSSDSSIAGLGALISSVRVGGLVVIIVDAAVAFAVMFWRRGAFHFLRAMTVNLLVGWVIFMFFTAGHREVILSLGATRMTALLWGCLSVVISYVLSFLPAIITAGIAKLAHTVLDAIL